MTNTLETIFETLSDLKTYISSKVSDAAESLDLQHRAARMSSKAEKLMKDAAKKAKRTFSPLEKNKSQKKSVSPLVAIVGVFGILLATFLLLVAVFYGIFWFLDQKRNKSYFSVRF